MRTFVAICLIALIATSFAAHSKSKSKTSNKDFSKDLKSALSMKQGLKMLVETRQDDETREVRRVLEAVRDEVQGTLDNVRERYSNEESDYETNKALYLEQLRTFETNLDETRVALQYANDEIQALTESIASSQANIEEAEGQQATEEARRVGTHEAFKAQYDKLSEASQAVEDALKLVVEIDNEDLEDAFLELSNKKIYKTAKKIHHIVNHVGISSHMTTFAATFLEVAVQGVNRELVDKLTTLLVALGEQIDDSINEAVERDNADDTYSRAVIGNLDNTIETEEAAIEENTGYLNGYLEQAERLEEDEQTWTSYLEDTAAHFQDFEAAWEEKAHGYEKLIHRLEDDILALDAADNFLDA